MILETVCAVADWLGHATYGVDAQLAALTYDGSDTAPSGTHTVIDETRTSDAAIDRPPTPPFLKVVAGEVRSLAGEAATYTHTGLIPLGITIERRQESPAALVRDLYYVQRAVLRCIERLFDPSITAAATACLRNNVQLQVIVTLSAARVAPTIEDNTGSAAVYVTVQSRDITA